MVQTKINKKWILKNNLIRHKFDGRVLDIEWWKFEHGTNVNVVTNHFGGKG